MASENHYVSNTSLKTKEQCLKEAIDYYNAKRYEDSLKACEKAIQLDCNYARAYIGKGLSLCKLGGYEEALLASERALQLNPNNANAHNVKGNALVGLKRYGEAVDAYKQALSINPKYKLDSQYIVCICEEGDAFRKLGQYADALTAYEQVVQLDPNFAYAYFRRGLTLHYLKRYEEALICYEQATTISHDTTSGKKYRAEFFSCYKITLEDYDNVIRRDGKTPSHEELLNVYHHRLILGSLGGSDITVALTPFW